MVAALAIGIPLGAFGGSFLWSMFARALDVVASPRVPTPTIIALAFAAIVVANVTAVLPARRARRLQSAAVLRTE
jgi:ABC-type antimicrobial peptide transport system permease subunit